MKSLFLWRTGGAVRVFVALGILVAGLLIRLSARARMAVADDSVWIQGEASFSITKVLNLYEPLNTTGTRSMGVVGQCHQGWSYTSQDGKGRIYESSASTENDTSPQWSQGEQYVVLEVQMSAVIADNYTSVEWTWEDPDDPSDGTLWGGRSVDPVAKTVLDPNGDDPATGIYDNTGSLQYGKMIWEKASDDYPLTNSTANSDNPRQCWQSAQSKGAWVRTPIVRSGPNNTTCTSRVRFNVSNRGGDNFKVWATLVNGDQVGEPCVCTGVMTLWKRVPLHCVAMQGAWNMFDYNGSNLMPDVNSRFQPAFIEFVNDGNENLSADSRADMGNVWPEILDNLSCWVDNYWHDDNYWHAGQQATAQPGAFFLGMAHRFSGLPQGNAQWNIFVPGATPTPQDPWLNRYQQLQQRDMTEISEYAASIGGGTIPAPVLLTRSVGPAITRDRCYRTTIAQSGGPLPDQFYWIDVPLNGVGTNADLQGGVLLYQWTNDNNETSWAYGGKIQSVTANQNNIRIEYAPAQAPFSVANDGVQYHSGPVIPNNVDVVAVKVNNGPMVVTDNTHQTVKSWVSNVLVPQDQDQDHLLAEPKMFLDGNAFTNDWAVPDPRFGAVYRSDNSTDQAFLWNTNANPIEQYANMWSPTGIADMDGYTIVPEAPYERYTGEHPDAYPANHLPLPIGATIFTENLSGHLERNAAVNMIVHELTHCFRIAHRCGNRDFCTDQTHLTTGKSCVMAYQNADAMFDHLNHYEMNLALQSQTNSVLSDGWHCAVHISSLRNRTLAEVFAWPE